MQPEYIRGLAATWDTDKNGTRYARDAFDRSRRLFDAGRLRIPLLWGHDFTREHGELIELRPTKAGLEITARVTEPPSPAGPLGLSVGMVYSVDDAERLGAEIVVRDGILREVSFGTVDEVANVAGAVASLDQVATSFEALTSAGHAALPTLCAHCAAGLSAAVARPQPTSFDQLFHCPHHSTTVQANVQAGRVTGWHFLSPVTAEQHAAMIQQRRGR